MLKLEIDALKKAIAELPGAVRVRVEPSKK
jgi:hypothetical protein